MKITKRWLEMSEIYKKFGPKEECYDFGDISAFKRKIYKMNFFSGVNLSWNFQNGF